MVDDNEEGGVGEEVSELPAGSNNDEAFLLSADEAHLGLKSRQRNPTACCANHKGSVKNTLRILVPHARL